MLAALQTQAAPPPTPADQIKKEKGLAATVSRDGAVAAVRELTAFGPRMGGTPSGIGRPIIWQGACARCSWMSRSSTIPRRMSTGSSWSVELGAAPLRSAWPRLTRHRVRASRRRCARTGARDRRECADSAGKGAGGRRRDPDQRIDPRGLRALRARGRRPRCRPDVPRDPNSSWTGARSAPSPRRRARAPRDPESPSSGSPTTTARSCGAPCATARRGPSPSPCRWTRTWGAGGRAPSSPRCRAGARAQRTLMVCAHGDSDSGRPGADDNASGVAAVLEVARALWRRTATSCPRTGPRCASPSGAANHSPEAWIKEHPEEVSRLQAVLNYDECGPAWSGMRSTMKATTSRSSRRCCACWRASRRTTPGRRDSGRAHQRSGAGRHRRHAFLPRAHQGVGLVSRDIPATTIFTAAWAPPTAGSRLRAGLAGLAGRGAAARRLQRLLPLVGRHAGEHHRSRAVEHGAVRAAGRDRPLPDDDFHRVGRLRPGAGECLRRPRGSSAGSPRAPRRRRAPPPGWWR